MLVETKSPKKASLLQSTEKKLSNKLSRLREGTFQRIFNHHPLREQQFEASCDDLALNFSNQFIDLDTLTLLEDFAAEHQLQDKIQDLMSGKIVNPSEQRPALHTALRDPSSKPIWVNNQNIKPQIEATLNKMYHLCHKAWENKIEDILVLGIGGSFWGSQFVCGALKGYPAKLRVHFLADIEEAVFHDITQPLNPAKTWVLVITKSFQSSETLLNAKRAQDWLNTYAASHMIAITAAAHKAHAFGISIEHILDIWPWVGGRYSVWSSVGMPIALCYGVNAFEALLDGAHIMDNHTIDTPFNKNLPMLAALITFINTRYLGAQSEAIIPYGYHLNYLIPYVQQLSMESLGKCHDLKGNFISDITGPIVWGQTGLHAQHTFNQLLHQSNHTISIDLIFSLDKPELLHIGLAQSAALTFGMPHHPLPYAQTLGNKPHNLIKMKSITPKSLGLLMAFYEHKTYLLACLFYINAFDQFGVELAKQLNSKDIEC